MQDKQKIFNQIKSLLNEQHFGVLATQGNEYPYCSLVGFAATEDCSEIIFATIRDTHKYKNIKQTPKVSLLIDSQTNQANDISQAQALTVLGTAEEVVDLAEQEYLGIYLQKLPYLKEFITAPNCALIRVSVFKYILVNNFQDTHEYVLE